MQLNKKLKILCTFIVVAVFAVTTGLFTIQGFSANEAQAQNVVEDKAPSEHGSDREADHGEEEDGDEHEEGAVRLTEAELKEFGIVVSEAGPGQLNIYVDLPGEIVINADRQAHVVPRVPGIVREVRKNLGDQVKGGEVLAVLESRQLADSKAEYLASRERLGLAEANFKREERLWKKKVSAEQEYLDARQVLAEARINLRSSEQKLHALGFAENYLEQLPEHPDQTYTRYEMKAPFAGAVIQKHISLGEALNDSSEAFIVADLSTVWVDINVYQKDLVKVRLGQQVVIEIGHGFAPVHGVLSYVGPVVGEETRTALARVVLPNPQGKLRPGMFITARVATESTEVALLVPKTALQTLAGKTVVFVLDEDGFEPRPVTVGKANGLQVEIEGGLLVGDKYASTGAFTLKAQISKSAFSGGHGH